MSTFLQSLTLHDFRVYQSRFFEFNQQVNGFYGPNGSGKTALLEAIYCLAHGRSFRASVLTRCIHHDASAWCLSGNITDGEGGVQQVGLQKGRTGSLDIKQDGVALSMRALASQLPMVYLGHDSLKLIESGPEGRRKWLDWICFYTNHAFIDHWSEYQRVLKQRNQLLKRLAPPTELAPWDKLLIESGEQVDKIRQSVSKELSDYLLPIIETWLEIDGVGLEYSKGWSEALTLENALQDTIASDRHAGFTHQGPHRADFKCWVNHLPAAQVLSRGQNKVFTTLLWLAGADFINRLSPQYQPIVLIDDLASELDRSATDFIYQQIQTLPGQKFYTGISISDLPEFIESPVSI